jgi:hypothetical protein
MSTLVQSVIDEAAMEIGDPNKERIEQPQWVTIYNMSNRELCQKVNLLRLQDDFDLIAGQTRYDFPQGMVEMNGIAVSQTPTDESTFQWLDEIFEDEFRALTSGAYPIASVPDRYFATSSWFYVIGAAETLIGDGGFIDYFGLPDEITTVDSSTVLQVDDLARDYLRNRMVIHGHQARNRLIEAKTALDIWNDELLVLQDKLADRSNDRRSSLAPRRNPFAGMR